MKRKPIPTGFSASAEKEIRLENKELRARLAEAEETLNAIRNGEVDAILVDGTEGEKIFSLASAETPYRIIIEEMNEGAALMLCDGTILYCNKRFSELMSVPLEKIIGGNFLLFFENSQKQELRQLLGAGKEKTCGKEIRKSKINAKISHHYFSFSPLPSTVVGDVCVLASDITELKEKEVALQYATNFLEQSVNERTLELKEEIKERKKIEESLNRINAEKDKFFSIIAHDLRTPFSAFLGFTQMMAEELPNFTLDQIQNIAVKMRKSASNLYDLLENLLKWAQLQRGMTTFTPTTFLVLPKLSDSLSAILESASNKRITIGYQITDDLEIYGDENMFATIIRNLVSNAIKFTHKGGEIMISAEKSKDQLVEISIRDNGIGMKTDMVKNLFRLDADTNRKGTENEPSTGLGLIICKEFIEENGGKLWVESEEGKGSCFFFTMPLNKEPLVL